ncbi:amidase [Bordetella pertussis]|nr:amidase [Bordetella pertussis]
MRIVRRADCSLVDGLERAIAQAGALSMRLISWEHHWSLKNMAEQHPGTLGPSLVRQLELGQAMTLERYRHDMLEREAARQRLAALATQCDALVSQVIGQPHGDEQVTAIGRWLHALLAAPR